MERTKGKKNEIYNDRIDAVKDLKAKSLRPSSSGMREPGGGGAAVGQLASTTWKLWGAPPPNFGLSMSFIFFLHVNLGLSSKNSGSNLDFLVLSRGYLPWTSGDVCPPPPPPTSK